MKYTFEYMFIPQLIENGDFAFPNYHDFDDMVSLKCALEEFGVRGDTPFSWDELTVVKYMSMQCTYWLFRFPKPEREPEAVYGMVVKSDVDEFSYYTLEMGDRGSYFFCKMKDGMHMLLEPMDGLCTQEEFKEKVFADLQKENSLL